MDYLRVISVGNLYDWVDTDNKNIDAPTVGYLNKWGIKEMKKQDACNSPIAFKKFIESEYVQEMCLCKDLYELRWRYGAMDYAPHKEWYHSLEDLAERYGFLKSRAYRVSVYDLNGRLYDPEEIKK